MSVSIHGLVKSQMILSVILLVSKILKERSLDLDILKGVVVAV